MTTVHRPTKFTLTPEQQARLQKQREQTAAEKPQPAAAGSNESTKPNRNRRCVARFVKRFTAAGGSSHNSPPRPASRLSNSAIFCRAIERSGQTCSTASRLRSEHRWLLPKRSSVPTQHIESRNPKATESYDRFSTRS